MLEEYKGTIAEIIFHNNENGYTVGRIMGTLQQSGFEAYVVGECISDSLAGKKPFGWDISTNARLADMKKLFPDAKVLSEKFEVIRFEYIEEIVDKDGEVTGESGIIIQSRRSV